MNGARGLRNLGNPTTIHYRCPERLRPGWNSAKLTAGAPVWDTAAGEACRAWPLPAYRSLCFGKNLSPGVVPRD
jgi:hypothetical protein